MAEPALRCVQVSVAHGARIAVRELDLDVAEGEVLALLGPSGSGKSTLLHAIAGFLPPAAGEIRLAGRIVATPHELVPPESRAVAMVFQNHALWPHLSVLETVAYPARRRGIGRRQARADAAELLERLSLARLAERRPAELSGGEQQRVGLARALAREAALYLFDEPTAHLDTHLRAAFQAEAIARQRATGAAAVYATHDAGEALALADQVALLDAGRLVQLGPPDQVYAEPVSLWAARLTGPASVISAPLVSMGNGMAKVTVGGAETKVAVLTEQPITAGAQLLVRPDWTAMGGPLPGVVLASWFRGPHTDHLLDTPAGEVLVREPGQESHPAGTRLSWDLHRVWPVN
ncbi:MAG: iron(III) transport system ATP-binding protein [Kribbellaceae bacterium]|jgi:ABC-type Fe3+/spermidine/putrescine transport system ATPase subunit|nr:iron(III) transport system ATP-binding protein [Kribbellaceae bacterium]